MHITIWEFLALTWEWIMAEYRAGAFNDAIQWTDQRINEVAQMVRNAINTTQTVAEQWLAMAILTTIVGLSISTVIFLLGILISGFVNAGWVNAIAGLLIAPILFILLVLWTPLAFLLGVVIEITHLRFKNAPAAAVKYAQMWLKLIAGILFWQVIVSLAFTFIPYWNAPSRIPVIILLSLAMAFMSIRWGRFAGSQTIIKILVVLMFLIQVTVCFLPTAATALHSKLGKTDLAFADGINNGFTGKPQMQEKIVPFKPGQPSNSGLVTQLGDTVQYINPTAPFKVPGKEKFHDISVTTEHVSTGSGSIVIYGSEKEGYVQIKVIPKRT